MNLNEVLIIDLIIVLMSSNRATWPHWGGNGSDQRWHAWGWEEFERHGEVLRHLRLALQQVFRDYFFSKKKQINNNFLGAHRSKKTTEPGKETTTVKLLTTSLKEWWTIVMDLDRKLATSEGESMLNWKSSLINLRIIWQNNERCTWRRDGR